MAVVVETASKDRTPDPGNPEAMTHGYFRLWRRKIGVITLVMACLFTAGWVRSLSVQDSLRLSIGGDVHVFVTSRRDDLDWYHYEYIGDIPSFPTVLGWRSEPVHGSFGGLTFAYKRKGYYERWTIPYWSIVIPLTFLSAWLLLSKSRVKKLAPTPPHPNKNADSAIKSAAGNKRAKPGLANKNQAFMIGVDQFCVLKVLVQRNRYLQSVSKPRRICRLRIP